MNHIEHDGPLVETSEQYYLLMWCPACGEELGSKGAVTRHLLTHDPADFGLTPMGERQDNDDLDNTDTHGPNEPTASTA